VRFSENLQAHFGNAVGEQSDLSRKTFRFLSKNVFHPYDSFVMRFDFSGSDRFASRRSQRSPTDSQEPATIRRKQMRYPLRTPITFRWSHTDGSSRHGKGWTRNVSEEGALISTANCPSEGDQVDLVLQIPAGCPAIPTSIFRMDMKAEVVRLLLDSSRKKICGFAVRKCSTEPRSDWQSTDLALQFGGLVGSREN
jgi:PilZ domain